VARSEPQHRPARNAMVAGSLSPDFEAEAHIAEVP
jgi:hypothetical protein